MRAAKSVIVADNKNEGTKDLKVREWTCPKCHAEHDRDVNASINILMQGILAN